MKIGVAVAAMLKEPLAALAKNQKLQISFEFVPKPGKAQPAPTEPKSRKAAKARARQAGSRQNRRQGG